ncbi:MAG: Flp pilus assembly protein CpaB [bacterium]
MRSKSNRKKIMIAVTAGIISAFGIFTSFTKKDAVIQDLSKELQSQKTELGRLSQNLQSGVNVVNSNLAVVSRQNIPSGVVLTTEMMEAKQINAKLMPPDVSNNLYSLVGKISAKAIKAGDFIKNSDVMENSFAGLDLPEGMRAISIPVSYIQGLASYITKGSYVDIISMAKTATEQPELILQNVKIISLEGVPDGTAQSVIKATAITFQIPAGSSARIVDAMMSGKLQVVARNFTDKKIIGNKSYKKRHSASSSGHNYGSIIPGYKLPEVPSISGVPTLPAISSSGLPLPAAPKLQHTKSVELIQANVKSEVNFNSDY